MTRAPKYPAVDPRRTSELRRALLRDIAAMAPFWRGAHEEKGADRALVEAAARLHEEATKRLDRTPERDALAFLDMFDIAPPWPAAAEGLVVFALKEKRESPVEVPARTGIEIATDDDKAPFETRAALKAQPGRIGMVAAIDPVTDRIEVAQTAVTTLEPDLDRPPVYRLLTDTPAQSAVIAIEPVVGLATGDLLRIEFRNDARAPLLRNIAAIAEDGRVTLTEPIGEGDLTRDAVGTITRQMAFETFAMPNRQEHGFYIGDADVLNVKEPAEFRLELEPITVATDLIAGRARFEIFGTRETPAPAEKEPRWHELVRTAAPGDDFILLKAWGGPVDEVELGGRKSRFIRIVPPGAVTVGSGPLTTSPSALHEIRIGVKTRLPAEPGDETVAQVAHNGQPLSAAAPFLPFGAEPQRFDVFALAAPEIFTKPAATAEIDFELADSTVLALTGALRADGDRHLYGVSRNGRLQVMDATVEESPVFREIGGPMQEDGAFPLDPTAGLRAQSAVVQSGGKSSDLVFARTVSGVWQVAKIGFDRNVADQADPRIELTVAWQPLPALPPGALAEDADGTPEVPAIAITPGIHDGTNYESQVLAVTSRGFWWLNVDSGAGLSAGWTVLTAPDDGGDQFEPPLSPVLSRVEDAAFLGAGDPDAFDRRSFLTVDRTGSVWLLTIGSDHSPQAFNDLGIQADRGVRPEGMFHGGGTELSIATVAGNALTYHGLTYPSLANPTTETLPNTSLPEQTVLGFLPGMTEGRPPQLVAYAHAPGGSTLLEWAPAIDTRAVVHTAVPGGVVAAGARPSVLALHPRREGLVGYADARASAVVAGEKRTILTLALEPSVEAVSVSDWVRVPDADPGSPDLTVPAIWRINGAGDIEIDVNVAIVGDLDDDAVARLTDTDLSLPVVVCRVQDESDQTSVDLDGVELSGGGALGLAADDLVLVATTGASPTFRLFAVDSGEPADSMVTLRAPDGLEGTLQADIDGLTLGGSISVNWRRAREVYRIDPGNRAEHERTLIEFPGTVPALVRPFEAGGQAGATGTLTGTGGVNLAILTGHGGEPPVTGLFKFAAAATEAQSLTSTGIADAYSAPRLSWEYFDGDGWKRLAAGFYDTTRNFATSGRVIFTVPHDLKPTDIGGQENHWIRARLVGGDYGQPKYIVDTTGTEQTITVDTSHMRPPEVSRVRAFFKLEANHLPTLLVTRNNLQDIDVSGANGLAGARISMFQGADTAPLTPAPDPDEDAPSRAILVGFDKPITTGTVSLLVKATDGEPSRGPPLRVHTLGADTLWHLAPLTGEDATRGLTRSGLLSVQVTTEPARIALLGMTLHWVRLSGFAAGDGPRIEGLYLNGVSVIQATTVERELVGSSSGEGGQTFRLLRPPLIDGSLELRVLEKLGEEEVAALRKDARSGEPDAVLDAVPNLPGQWVLWQQVDSFAGRGADRIYRADAEGHLRFGDGRQGGLLPAGRDNVRAFRYRSGGRRVATAAYAKASVTGTVESLEQLLAPLPVSGGRDLPERAELVARMPDVLRRASTALTLADIEAAARDADDEIAQVRAFAPTAARDRVLVAVLARGEGRMTQYGRAARENLARVLSRAMSDAWGPDCLDVVSVGFVELTVDVALVATPGRQAELEAEANRLLGHFLDPARGGPGGAGWPPGRPLWPTDLRRALLRLPVLDRVERVAIGAKDEARDPSVIGPAEVIAASPSDIGITVLEGAT